MSIELRWPHINKNKKNTKTKSKKIKYWKIKLKKIKFIKESKKKDQNSLMSTFKTSNLGRKAKTNPIKEKKKLKQNPP